MKMGERKYNEEKFNSMKVEGDDARNAAICDQIADSSLMWNPGEAVYWRKKAIEIVENHYGKGSWENTFYYDKIVNDLLEKGCYKQAIKWNNKSKKIKMREKGESTFELIINEVYEMDLNIFLEQYDSIVGGMERVKCSLQKNADGSPSYLYYIYLQLVRIGGTYRIYTEKELGDTVYFADKAIDIAQNTYGEDSIETAEAYRMKAIELRHIGFGEADNKEALDLLKRALLIAIKIEGNKGKNAKTIFFNIRQCWDESSCWKECIKWACKNLSIEFVLDIMRDYPKFIQQEINETLKTII